MFTAFRPFASLPVASVPSSGTAAVDSAALGGAGTLAASAGVIGWVFINKRK